MNELNVVGVGNSEALRYEVVFDQYVPMEVRSSSGPIGAGFLRLGDYSATLLELSIEPHTQRLRGATLTSVAKLVSWPSIWVTGSYNGPPILSTGFDRYRVQDLSVQFEVALGDDGIVVFWDRLNDCVAYECGRVRFLARAGVLSGIWCTDVKKTERALFLGACAA
jgi:hypothetical protein